MPVPILLVNNSEKPESDKPFVVDYSKIEFNNIPFSFNQRSAIQDMFIKVSDSEAGLLFNLWKNSKSSKEDDIDIPEGFSNNDILKLKSSGLICGGLDKVKLTSRGKEVIQNIVLSEENALSKTSSTTISYNKILSESKIKGGIRRALGKKS